MREKHILSAKLPVLSMLLAMTVTLLVLTVPSLFVSSAIAQNYIMCVIAVLWMMAMKWWFRPEFKGIFKAEVPFREILLFFGIYLIATVASIVASAADTGWYFKPTALALSMGFAAGFYEETIVRGVTIPIGMRYLKGKNRILLIAIGTSLVFGLSHLGNISQGAPASMAVAQAISSTFHGLFYAAVVLRTGSILTTVVMHGFYDWICFVTDPTLDNGIMTGQDITGGLVIQVAIAVALGIAGLYLIRPAVRDRIEDIWKKKWSGEVSAPVI